MKYICDREGNIYSVGRNGEHRKLKLQSGGRYYHFALSRVSTLAHRFIYEYFNGPIAEGLVVNHIDGNGFNNRLDNLEVVSRSSNTLHSYYSLRRGNIKLHEDDLLTIEWLRKQGYTFKDLSKLYGFFSSSSFHTAYRRTRNIYV
jgi:hypothetical protein